MAADLNGKNGYYINTKFVNMVDCRLHVAAQSKLIRIHHSPPK